MNKVCISAFVLAMVVSIVGCNSTIPWASSRLQQSSSHTAQQNTTNSDSTGQIPTEEDILAIFTDETAKYFRYLDRMPMGILYDGDPNFGFTDTSISGFAIAMAIKQQGESFDFEKGASREQLDEITKKYFNRVVLNYNNRLTHVLDNGNIASIGWGIHGASYILKELTQEASGIITAVFYMVSESYGEDLEHLQRLSDIVHGNFDRYGDVFLSEIKFIEKSDENDHFYLQFISLKSLGRAEKPYRIYSGA